MKVMECLSYSGENVGVLKVSNEYSAVLNVQQ